MDWLRSVLCVLWVLMPIVYGWSAIPKRPSVSGRQRNEVSPYLDLVLCPLRAQPWSCARQQSGRILDVWDGELNSQWQKLKVEADQQLNATLEKRGYSASQFMTKEKPSTILKKIEIGTNYMKEYLAESMDGFLGREYEYMQNFKNHNGLQNAGGDSQGQVQNDEPDNDDEDSNDDDDNDNDDGDEGDDDEDEDDEESANEAEKNSSIASGNDSGQDDEFIEIAGEGDDDDDSNNDDDTLGELKKPGGGGDKRRKKKKKKGDTQHDIGSQAANLLIIQPLQHQLAQEHHEEEIVHKVKPVRTKLKPVKQKRRKRKKKGQEEEIATVVVEQQPSSDHLGLGLLEELSEVDLLSDGGKRKKHPMKYGRSNGVTRGKKKKKKKAIMKLMLLGSFLKAKIELLLKILGAHLQIKFFAIALIGLLINIARFWIDVKRGGSGQKVVYVEHAHHQHHYEDHGDDWNESAGGYWKRSLQTDNPEDDYHSSTDSYQPQPQTQQVYNNGQYLAYRNQWQRK